MPYAHPSGFPPRSLACPRDCSSGSPDPERRMERRTHPGLVARGPVPRDRSTYAKNARRPRPFSVPIEARRGTGPRPTVKRRRPCKPSRGGLSPAISRPTRKPNADQGRFPDRGTARDRPSPYGETETAWHTVARGTGPRDRSTYAKTERQPTVSPSIEAWRGTGPRPTVNGTLFLTVARGTGPRATGPDEKTRGTGPRATVTLRSRGTGPRAT